jgi:hypothetical protein
MEPEEEQKSSDGAEEYDPFASSDLECRHYREELPSKQEIVIVEIVTVDN